MGRVELANGAQWVRLTDPLRRAPVANVSGGRGGGVRGKVRGFSRGSRRRLLDLLNKVRREHVAAGLFVTLTYPGVWDDSWETWKRDIDTFGKRLLRRYPGASFVWRLEYQKRGAPHFHLLVFGVPLIPHKWLARSWYEIVGSGDERHLAAGTEVKRVRRFRSVIAYAAKYISKEQGADDARCEGRVWGVVGRANLPIEIVTLSAVPDRVWWSVRRIMRKRVEKRSRFKWWSARSKRGTLSVYFDCDSFLRLLAAETARLYSSVR